MPATLLDTKVQVAAHRLLTIVRDAASLVEAKPLLPITSNVLLKGRNGLLTATATNTQLYFTSAPLEVDGELDVDSCVDARRLVDTLKQLGKETISLTPQGLALVVNGPNGRYRIPGEPPKDFPAGPTLTGGVHLDLDGVQLRRGLSAVLPWVNKDTSLPLNGVLLHQLGDELVVVAADRPAFCRAKVGLGELPSPLLLPATAAKQVLSLVQDAETVEVQATKTRALFRLERGDLSTTLRDDTFPAYAPIFEQELPYTLLCDRDALAGAVKRAAVFAEEEFTTVALSLDGFELRINAYAGADTEAADWLNVEYHGEPLVIGLSAPLLLQALGALPEGQVRIVLAAPNLPVRVSSVEHPAYPVTLINSINFDKVKL